MIDLAKLRGLLWALGALLVLALGLAWLRARLLEDRIDARPNVLLVVLDTTRADYLSSYGHPRPTTPRLDRLAAEGTLYLRAYATSFWTLPSHASLLTGLYPSVAGATSETNHLPADAETLAELLRGAGYRTGAVIRNAWISEERGFGQGFDDFIEAWRGEGSSPGPEAEQAAVDAAVAWLEEREATEGPFFLLVNLNVAHLPYLPPEDSRRRFSSEPWPPERVARLMEIKGGWQHLAGELPLDDTDYRILRQLYAAEVATADELVGQILDALEDDGRLDDTLVIVTSDHGENLGEHGMIDHMLSMYDTTTRVPLIIRYPERFEAGAREEDLVSLVDIVPTVLDVCSLIEARDPEHLRSSLASSERVRRPAVFAENARPINGIERLRRWFPHFDATRIDHAMRMIRTDRFKLVWRVNVAASLFDLERDPGETVDVAGERRELRDDLLAALRRWALSLDARAGSGPFESRDRESLEQLRSLGYLE